jgi:DNA-binding MarR family transcriptional regulator
VIHLGGHEATIVPLADLRSSRPRRLRIRSRPEPVFSPQADVVASLGLSKQMASQLIDTLVLRDYLERRTAAHGGHSRQVRSGDVNRTRSQVVSQVEALGAVHGMSGP